MNFLHKALQLADEDVVEVTLDNPANVQLLDPENYEAYRQGKLYRYHGGYAEASPVEIPAPHAGEWHLVVDLGGGVGHVRAGYRVLSGAADVTALKE